jgi:hypothetical protein
MDTRASPRDHFCTLCSGARKSGWCMLWLAKVPTRRSEACIALLSPAFDGVERLRHNEQYVGPGLVMPL